MYFANTSGSTEYLGDILHNTTSDPNPFKELMGYLHIYLTPVIIIIGVITNILSCIVFLSTPMRLQSSSIYLASLAMSDCLFLLSLFISWFGWLKIHIAHQPVWCHAVVYIAYTTSFLSVWIITSFTVERYAVVFYPFLVSHMSSFTLH